MKINRYGESIDVAGKREPCPEVRIWMVPGGTWANWARGQFRKNYGVTVRMKDHAPIFLDRQQGAAYVRGVRAAIRKIGGAA